MDIYMTEKEVVEWLKLKNVQQLRRLCTYKNFPFLPVTKKDKRFDQKEINTWLKNNRKIWG